MDLSSVDFLHSINVPFIKVKQEDRDKDSSHFTNHPQIGSGDVNHLALHTKVDSDMTRSQLFDKMSYSSIFFTGGQNRTTPSCFHGDEQYVLGELTIGLTICIRDRMRCPIISLKPFPSLNFITGADSAREPEKEDGQAGVDAVHLLLPHPTC